MTTLEKRFEQDMIDIYTTAKKECTVNDVKLFFIASCSNIFSIV